MKRKLIFLLLFFCSIPLVTSSFLSVFMFSQNMRDDYRLLSMSREENLQSEIKGFMSIHLDVLKLLAKNPAIQSYDVKSIKPVIVDASKTYPNLLPISVDNNKGKQIVRSDDLGLVDVSDRKFYQLALQGQEEVISEVVISKANGHPVVMLATPIKVQETGVITGVLQGTIDLSMLTEFVVKRSRDGNVAYILDQEGKVIAHPDLKMTAERKDLKQLPFVQKALQGEKGSEDAMDQNGNKILTSYGRDPFTGWIICLEQSYEEFIAKRNRIITMNVLVLVATMIAVSVVGVLVANKTAEPIARIVKATEAIRGGDLTAAVSTAGKDEIAVLAQNFNSMSNSLRDLVIRVTRSAEQVAAFSQQLTVSAEQSAQAAAQTATSMVEVAQGADLQLRTTTNTAVVVKRLSASIGQVAYSSSHVASVSDKAKTATEYGEKAIKNAIDQMNSIEHTVTQSAQVVESLGKRSQEIGQIVDTIAGIAGQTNLLALNAAIEAARAGEQGRGFAVVAEEVRKLAEQSHEAAKKIAELIQAVQIETGGAVDAMQAGTIEVRKGTEVVNKAGNSFKEIAMLIRAVSEEVARISESTGVMKEDSEIIVADVYNIEQISKGTSAQSQMVSAATEETTATIEEIAASSQSLARMAEELQVVISNFKV